MLAAAPTPVVEAFRLVVVPIPAVAFHLAAAPIPVVVVVVLLLVKHRNWGKTWFPD